MSCSGVNSEIEVIVLSAGKGTRLLPLTKDIPKCLVKIPNRPLIFYQLRALKENGIAEDHITVVIGYKAEKVRKYLYKNFKKVKIIENRRYNTTDNIYSLYLAILSKQGFMRELLLFNGDCFFSARMIKKALTGKNFLAVDMKSEIRTGIKAVVSDNKISGLLKKCKNKQNVAASTSFFRFSKEASECLRTSLFDCVEKKKMVNEWMEIAIREVLEKFDIKAYPIDGKDWFEIDTQEDINNAIGVKNDLKIF